MRERTPIEVVAAWHEALNREDREAVLDLSDPDVEIVGPRGSGSGHELLRQWLLHARVELRPRRYFTKGNVVVVEQLGTWRSPETGAPMGEAGIASVFRVRDGRIASYARFDSLEDALEQADMSEEDAL